MPSAAMHPAAPNPAGPHPATATVRAPRRVMLVTRRSQALLALDAACRRTRTTLLRFFADTDAACEQLARWRPDAVVLDRASAGRDGVQLAAQLRRRYPDVPLAVLAECSGGSLAKAARRTGADGTVLADDRDPVGRLAQLREERRSRGRANP